MIEELIDTLWNVNEIKVKARLTDDKELIDTLWNVNQRKGVNQMALTRN